MSSSSSSSSSSIDNNNNNNMMLTDEEQKKGLQDIHKIVLGFLSRSEAGLSLYLHIFH